MSRENVKRFYELTGTDASLAEKLLEVDKNTNVNRIDANKLEKMVEENIIPLAKERGLEFTADELIDYANEKYSHLSDEDLLAVSGGISTKNTAIGLSAILLLSLGSTAAINLLTPNNDLNQVISNSTPSKKAKTSAKKIVRDSNADSNKKDNMEDKNVEKSARNNKNAEQALRDKKIKLPEMKVLTAENKKDVNPTEDLAKDDGDLVTEKVDIAKGNIEEKDNVMDEIREAVLPRAKGISADVETDTGRASTTPTSVALGTSTLVEPEAETNKSENIKKISELKEENPNDNQQLPIIKSETNGQAEQQKENQPMVKDELNVTAQNKVETKIREAFDKKIKDNQNKPLTKGQMEDLVGSIINEAALENDKAADVWNSTITAEETAETKGTVKKINVEEMINQLNQDVAKQQKQAEAKAKKEAKEKEKQQKQAEAKAKKEAKEKEKQQKQAEKARTAEEQKQQKETAAKKKTEDTQKIMDAAVKFMKNYNNEKQLDVNKLEEAKKLFMKYNKGLTDELGLKDDDIRYIFGNANHLLETANKEKEEKRADYKKEIKSEFDKKAEGSVEDKRKALKESYKGKNLDKNSSWSGFEKNGAKVRVSIKNLNIEDINAIIDNVGVTYDSKLALGKAVEDEVNALGSFINDYKISNLKDVDINSRTQFEEDLKKLSGKIVLVDEKYEAAKKNKWTLGLTTTMVEVNQNAARAIKDLATKL